MALLGVLLGVDSVPKQWLTSATLEILFIFIIMFCSVSLSSLSVDGKAVSICRINC